MTVNNELKKTWKEAFFAKFRVTFTITAFPGGTEEYREKSLPHESVSRQRFEMITSLINITNLTTSANLFDILLYCKGKGKFFPVQAVETVRVARG
jgi:hypothetical protein